MGLGWGGAQWLGTGNKGHLQRRAAWHGCQSPGVCGDYPLWGQLGVRGQCENRVKAVLQMRNWAGISAQAG